MKKNTRPRVLSLLLALTLILGLLPGTAWAAGGTLEGDGTADSPYLIADAADLAAFRDKVNAEDSNASYARLTADIQLTGEWVPFNSLSGNPPTAYAGTFDGGGHTIKGLKIDDKSSSNGIGLFGTVNGATIKNLKVEGTVTASNSSFVGGIVGKTQGTVTIDTCSFSGSVTSNKASSNNTAAGGIVGRVNAGSVQISNCANLADITGPCAGGILGYCSAKGSSITNCCNSGTVTGTARTGGIAGQVASDTGIQSCYTKDGPVCGFNGSLTDCYNSASLNNISQLGSTFTTDADGNVILSWQAGATPAPKDPRITITGSATLYDTNSGPKPTATLTVNYQNIDNREDVVWSLLSEDSVVTLESPAESAKNNCTVVVQALKPGKATVHAQAGKYSAEAEIAVYPFVTSVEIEGTAAVGETVRAKVTVLGGDEYDYDAFPALTLQWKYLTGADYAAGNTSSSSYRTISGAKEREFTILNDFAGNYLSFTLVYNGEEKTPGRPTEIKTRAEGILSADSAALHIDTTEIKEPIKLNLPAQGEKGAQITWSSSDPAIIDPVTGQVTLPAEGTAEVTLTATLRYEGETKEKPFTIKVYAQAQGEDPAQTLADAAAALSQSPLKPVWGTDTNVITMARARLDRAGYEDVALSIRAVEEVYGGAGISEDGEITYFYADPNTTPALHSGSCRVTFLLSKGGQTLEQIVPAVIGWDADRVKAAMRNEILSQVTEASLCDGDSLQAVTRDLTLPKAVDGKRWTLIEWTSSDEGVISISGRNQSTADTLFNPYVGVVKRGESARQVTLTAAFNFQFTGTDEAPIRLYQTFSVTVPPMETDQLEAIRKGLEEKLDAGFAAKGLSDAVTGDRLTAGADGFYTAVHDLQFPTTRDFGVDGKYFPVTITSDNSAVLTPPDVSNAARVQVLRPGPGQPDGSAAVTVSLWDRSSGVTAARSFPIRVPALTQEEIDAELALMERVKASYFEGIKGGNTAKDNVRTDLAPFFEVYEQDGALVWVRTNAQRTGRGIVPVPMEGWEDLELWRLFRSSNPNVVSHEDLKVTRQTEAKAVTVTSRLSSQTLGRYGELYQSDPARYAQYAALSPLYYQEVSTDTSIRPAAAMARAARSSADTMVVRGTRDPDSSVPVVETVDNVTFCLTGLDGSVWIAPTVLSGLEESSTVYDVFLQMLGRDYTATRVKGTYIKAISGPGGSLAEKAHGENSGWMYRVNGSIPDVYMGACPLRDGDSIHVFYTRDAQQDDPNWSWPSGGNSSSGGSSSSSGNPSGGKTEGTNRQTVQLEKLSGAGLYAVTLPRDSSGPQLVTIPNVGQGQLVVIVHPDGREEVIKKSILEDNQAKFLLEENARVKVIDYANPFADVDSSAWYRSAVDFVSGRGLFSGVGQDSFAPELPLSRGMLASVLYRLEGAGPRQTAVSFADVASGAWYAPGTAWAAEAGIVSGYGSGRFGPDDSVTREQLAVILFRYAQLLGVNTGGRDSLSEFSDSGSVSGWAREAVAWAVDAGVISGLPGETLLPAGTATRAEAAAMLQRFVRLLLK